jgi:hypothetical protein
MDRFYINYIIAAILIASLLAFTGIVFWMIANLGAVPPAIWTPIKGGGGGGDDFPYWLFM